MFLVVLAQWLVVLAGRLVVLAGNLVVLSGRLVFLADSLVVLAGSLCPGWKACGWKAFLGVTSGRYPCPLSATAEVCLL